MEHEQTMDLNAAHRQVVHVTPVRRKDDGPDAAPPAAADQGAVAGHSDRDRNRLHSGARYLSHPHTGPGGILKTSGFESRGRSGTFRSLSFMIEPETHIIEETPENSTVSSKA